MKCNDIIFTRIYAKSTKQPKYEHEKHNQVDPTLHLFYLHRLQKTSLKFYRISAKYVPSVEKRACQLIFNSTPSRILLSTGETNRRIHDRVPSLCCLLMNYIY